MRRMWIRRRLSNSGVAEVVGTILILAMTVVLFAAIILWVATIPTPQASIRLDMDATLNPFYSSGGQWQGVNITVRHRGGETLYAFRTTLILTVQISDNTYRSTLLKTRGTEFGLPYGVEGPDANWQTGEIWRYTNTSVGPQDRVTLTVIDTVRSLILWSEPLKGPVGVHPPFFLEKWLDGDVATAFTRDIPIVGQQFGVFARVFDQDGDLKMDSVKATLTFGPKSTFRLYDDGTNGDARANDGVFTRVDPNLRPLKSWDGGIILLRAEDFAGHVTNSRLTFEVRDAATSGRPAGYGGTWNSTLGGIGQGDSGPEGDYGYNIYNETGKPTEEDPAGTPTRYFKPGEKVYVIARSTVLRNLENINSFILRNDLGYKLYPPTKEYDSRDPSKTNPAFTQTLTDPFYEYEYSFNAPSTNGAYGVEFTLKDNAGHAPFIATDRIWVTTSGSGPVSYPKIVTYKDPNNDGVLNDLVPATTFRWTDKLYIRVFFKDVDVQSGACSPWFVPPAPAPNTCPPYVNANAGDIEIQDYYGGFQVKKRAGSMPVSLISTYAFDKPTEKTYVLYVDLLRRDQAPWVPGTNFYALRLRGIADSGFGGTTPEAYQLLAAQVTVIAPLSTIDMVTVTEGGTSTGKKGRAVYWYERSFFYQEHEVEVLPNDAKKPLALAVGDLDGDTKVDIVIGLDAKEITNIVAYYNLDYGVSWRRDFINQLQKNDRYRAESLAIADLDGDGDGDIVAGIRDDTDKGIGVYIFWNDGSWSTQLLRYSEAGDKPNMRSLAIADLNKDGRPDIVSADKDGVVNWYCNNVRGSWLQPKDKKCPAWTSREAPLHEESFSKGVKVGKASEVMWNSVALGQMEGVAASLDPGNPNADDTVDIVVSNDKALIVYRTSVSNATGGNTPSWVRYDVQYTTSSDANNKRIHSVAVGDLNNDRMIDIAFGVDPDARTSGVFRVRNNGVVSDRTSAFNKWDRNILPHTTIDPKDDKVADLGKVKDIAIGDLDGDGDLDIIMVADADNDFLNNLWHYENNGDVPSTYIETCVYTDGWFKRKEKVFSVELAYIDL